MNFLRISKEALSLAMAYVGVLSDYWYNAHYFLFCGRLCHGSWCRCQFALIFNTAFSLYYATACRFAGDDLGKKRKILIGITAKHKKDFHKLGEMSAADTEGLKQDIKSYVKDVVENTDDLQTYAEENLSMKGSPLKKEEKNSK